MLLVVIISRKRNCSCKNCASSAIWHVGLCNPTHWPEWNICLHVQQLGFMGPCVSYVYPKLSDRVGGGVCTPRAGNDQPQVSETLSARASEPHHHWPFGVLACALQDLSCITVLHPLDASSRRNSQKCHWTLLGVSWRAKRLQVENHSNPFSLS